MTNNGLAIRWGATRLVVLTKRLAFKFPRPTAWRLFLNGLLCNMQERRFSATGWPELCPVLFSLPGGWLVVMPRCEPLEEPMIDWQYEAFINQCDYVVPVEYKIDSFGWLKGKIVAIDYGS